MDSDALERLGMIGKRDRSRLNPPLKLVEDGLVGRASHRLHADRFGNRSDRTCTLCEISQGTPR